MLRRRQVQVRLADDQVDELIVLYSTRDTVNELAARFGIHRTTVMKHIERAGVERRAGIIDRHLHEARELYESGLSLAKVRHRFGVNGETVRQAFKRAAIAIRTRNGWA